MHRTGSFSKRHRATGPIIVFAALGGMIVGGCVGEDPTESNSTQLIELQTTTLSFTVGEGSDPAPQTFAVTNGGSGTLSYAVTADRTWLSLAPTSGSLSGRESDSVTVSVNSAELTVGTHRGTVTVTANAGNSPQSVTVQLTVNERGAPVDTLRGVPLIDMGDSITYKGFAGWLYPGSNEPPPSHLARQPAIPTTSPFGFASLGMSNTWWEWCKSPWDEGTVGPHGCTDYSFTGAVADSVAAHPNLRLVSGAQGGKVAKDWASEFNSAWAELDQRLGLHGLEPQDLKVVWVKVVNRNPEVALPSADADAYELLEHLGDIVRLLRERYGVQQVYLSSRIWAPACAGPKNPEPYAYETGYAVKWLIEAQIEQLDGGPVDGVAGDLSLEAAPWLAWGPYLWADNGNVRSDGLTWSPDDMLDPCDEHPGVPGIKKVANLLVGFFRDSALTPWFRP